MEQTNGVRFSISRRSGGIEAKTMPSEDQWRNSFIPIRVVSAGKFFFQRLYPCLMPDSQSCQESRSAKDSVHVDSANENDEAGRRKRRGGDNLDVDERSKVNRDRLLAFTAA